MATQDASAMTTKNESTQASIAKTVDVESGKSDDSETDVLATVEMETPPQNRAIRYHHSFNDLTHQYYQRLRRQRTLTMPLDKKYLNEHFPLPYMWDPCTNITSVGSPERDDIPCIDNEIIRKLIRMRGGFDHVFAMTKQIIETANMERGKSDDSETDVMATIEMETPPQSRETQHDPIFDDPTSQYYRSLRPQRTLTMPPSDKKLLDEHFRQWDPLVMIKRMEEKEKMRNPDESSEEDCPGKYFRSSDSETDSDDYQNRISDLFGGTDSESSSGEDSDEDESSGSETECPNESENTENTDSNTRFTLQVRVFVAPTTTTKS